MRAADTAALHDAIYVECPDQAKPEGLDAIHSGGCWGRGLGAGRGRDPVAGVGSPPGKKVSWNQSEVVVAQHRECAKCH